MAFEIFEPQACHVKKRLGFWIHRPRSASNVSASYKQMRQHATQSKSNKPAEMLLTQQTYEYLLEHTNEELELQNLREATFAEWPKAKQMQVSPELGRFLSWLIASLHATNALELGVFTGYSSICIAKALSPGGVLVACESDARPLELAREAFAGAGVSHKIQIKEGKAASTLEALIQNGQQELFDFAFVDADKRGYPQYHELLLKLIRRGGVIVYDNMLWYGAVADTQDMRKSTMALRSFNAFLLLDKRVDFSLVPIGDGLALCRRL